MKRIIALITVLVLALSLTACGGSTEKIDIANAQNLADLAGAKIAAQAGTFHENALTQITDVQSSTYPEFTDLLTALKSGAIDGYIAEEPTALAVCGEDSSLTYIALENNDTGFTATAADVGIAVGLKTGSALKDQINAVLANLSEETKSQLMAQMVDLAAGKEIGELAIDIKETDGANGVLKVGMECAYEPFNWTNLEDKGNGNVEISSEGKEGQYANGYDVQIARYVAAELGMKLEIYAIEWDSLLPALNSGVIDAVVAGMSPTAEREEQIDFTNTYYESNLVVIIKK